jgi:hypothetical protein
MRITGTLHEDIFTFMAVSCWILLRMITISDTDQNPYFMFGNFSRKWHRLWDNVEKYGATREATNDVTTWRIRVARWISEATRAQARPHARAPTPTHSSTHASTHPQARARTHTHTHFPTATVVLWTRRNVTLYVHCLARGNKLWSTRWHLYRVFLRKFCVLPAQYDSLYTPHSVVYNLEDGQWTTHRRLHQDILSSQQYNTKDVPGLCWVIL